MPNSTIEPADEALAAELAIPDTAVTIPDQPIGNCIFFAVCQSVGPDRHFKITVDLVSFAKFSILEIVVMTLVLVIFVVLQPFFIFLLDNCIRCIRLFVALHGLLCGHVQCTVPLRNCSHGRGLQ